jgi:hypothetical protein
MFGDWAQLLMAMVDFLKHLIIVVIIVGVVVGDLIFKNQLSYQILTNFIL